MGKRTFEVKRYKYSKPKPPTPGTCGACSRLSVHGRRTWGYCMRFRREARKDDLCPFSDNAKIVEP